MKRLKALAGLFGTKMPDGSPTRPPLPPGFPNGFKALIWFGTPLLILNLFYCAMPQLVRVLAVPICLALSWLVWVRVR